MSRLGDFRHLPHTRARGKLGEDEAAAWLAARGYLILRRNLRNKAGEIDLIADQAGTLCFIEIKARASRDFGLAIEAVSPVKQRRLVGCRPTSSWPTTRGPVPAASTCSAWTSKRAGGTTPWCRTPSRRADQYRHESSRRAERLSSGWRWMSSTPSAGSPGSREA